MDPDSLNFYDLDEFDPKDVLNTYCLPDSDEAVYNEFIVFPMTTLQQLSSSDTIAGTTLIDISIGAVLFQVITVGNNFRDIILLKPNYFNIWEVEKWRYGEEEAFDWSHLSKHFTELGCDREIWIEKEECAKRQIQNIMSCDLSHKNPIDPFVLSKADCLTSFYLIEHTSKDKEAYCETIKKLSAFLNVGGHLFIAGMFNIKYFFIGEKRFHSLAIDEEFLRKALEYGGFAIEDLEVLDSKVTSDKIKYDHVFLVSARKVREV